MHLDPKRFEEFRTALAAIEPSAFGLGKVEIFPGATPYSSRSIVLCRFASGHADLIREASGEAARLCGAKLGIDIECGTVVEGAEAACWIEYFPGGANYAHAGFAMRALRTAIAGVAAARDPGLARLAQAELERFAQDRAPQVFVQSSFLVKAARRAGIPVERVGGAQVAWHFGWGRRSDIFYMTASTGDTVPGHQLTWRKPVAKQLFRELGLPTPEWRMLLRESDALRLAAEVGWPCVVKPTDRAFGAGVTANIVKPEQLRAAIALARSHGRTIMIEAHEPGDDYRLMVVDGRLIAAVRREPPHVTGDGKRTVETLIAELNEGRDGSREANYLLRVEHDAALSATLAAQRLTLQSVLGKGVRLTLRSVANFSTGGRGVDVLDEVHPQVRGMAELLAQAVGLRTAGIDYITPDITKGHDEAGGGFIEVNAMPRLRVLMNERHPEEEIGALVLGDRPGRIPITLIVGSAQELAEISEPVRKRTASATARASVSSQWLQVGATALPAAGLDPYANVAAALRHTSVDEVIVLWTVADAMQFGLPADRIDRAIVIGNTLDAAWLERCAEVVNVDSAAAAQETLAD